MASVTFGGIWFHDADDHADLLEVRGLTALTATTEVPGEVREYAGGRRIARRRPGRRTPLTCTVRLDRGRQGLGWLNDHAGRVLMVRDFTGNPPVWGVIWTVPAAEVAAIDTVDLTLTVDPVSQSAAV